MNIGLLGCGQHTSNTMLANIIGNKDCTIVAACDINTERLVQVQKRLGDLNTYTQATEMFENEQIDIVVISVNPEMHVKYTKLALENNVNVYVEKPIGHDFKAIKDLHELACSKDLSVEYGAKRRYTNATRIAKEWMEKNSKKASLITLDATFPIGLVKEPWGLSPMNGAIQEVFVHAIDYILSWVGYDIADIKLNIASNEDWHQAVNIILCIEDGPIVSMNLIKGSGAYQSNFILHTTTGEQIKIYNLSSLEITTNDSWANTHGTFRDHPSLNWDQGRLYRSWGRAGMSEVWNALVEDVKNKKRECKALERAYMGQKIVQQLWNLVEQDQ